MFKKRIELDPVKDNLCNRIAPGGAIKGAISMMGGVLVQGTVIGEPMHVHDGPLLLQEDGVLRGRIIVDGDAYIFGIAGDPNEPEGSLDLEVRGVIHLASTCRTYGVITCAEVATYKGCEVNSKIRTLQQAATQAAVEKIIGQAA